MEYFVVGVAKGTLVAAVSHCLLKGWNVSDYDSPTAKPRSCSRPLLSHPKLDAKSKVGIVILRDASLPSSFAMLGAGARALIKKYGGKRVLYGSILPVLIPHCTDPADASSMRSNLLKKGVITAVEPA